MKVLNLYAGIGGNRKLWEDVDVTAVEIHPDIAAFYREEFPEDDVVVGDAHQFLQDNLDDGWDFIWTSPPCQTHSRISRMAWASDAPQNASREPKYPDMRLYQEILFLRYFADCRWVVENVQPYYGPLIEPQKAGRHLFWANFDIPPFESDIPDVWKKNPSKEGERHYGFDLSDADLGGARKDQVLNNCVDPELGLHVLKAATRPQQQATLPLMTADGGLTEDAEVGDSP